MNIRLSPQISPQILPQNRIRIATRKSELAQIQANQVKALLLAAYPNLLIEMVYFSTQGDEITNRPLAEIGGKALFIKTLEEALIENKADIAVHSLKDVPSVLSNPFWLMAYLPRENPADVFLSRDFSGFSELPVGASVGTSSPRRSAQLQHLRPDLKVKMLRGNVPTRVEKILSGEWDAGVLAYAGLKRLNLINKIKEILPIHLFMPAPGQGIITVQCLASRQSEFQYLTKILNSGEAEKMAVAERSFAAKLGGDCYSPIAAWAEVQADELILQGEVFSPEGSRKLSGVKKIKLSDTNAALNLGTALAEELLQQGAQELLQCH